MEDPSRKTPSYQLIVRGRLGNAPTLRDTRGKTIRSIATGRMAVQVPDRSVEAADGQRHTLWLRLVAFDALAEYLSRHHKGDLQVATGSLRYSQFTGRDGIHREVWECLVSYLDSERAFPPLERPPERPVVEPQPKGRAERDREAYLLWEEREKEDEALLERVRREAEEEAAKTPAAADQAAEPSDEELDAEEDRKNRELVEELLGQALDQQDGPDP